MKDNFEPESRTTKRIPHQALIRFSSGSEDDFRTARMYNYSHSGMYLELHYPPPKLGANLLIEVMDPQETNTSELSGMEKSQACYYAKVVWKKNLVNSQADYGFGLEYLQAIQDN